MVDACQAERELIKGAQEKAREDERRTIAINLYQGGMTVEKLQKGAWKDGNKVETSSWNRRF